MKEEGIWRLKGSSFSSLLISHLQFVEDTIPFCVGESNALNLKLLLGLFELLSSVKINAAKLSVTEIKLSFPLQSGSGNLPLLLWSLIC